MAVARGVGSGNEFVGLVARAMGFVVLAVCSQALDLEGSAD